MANLLRHARKIRAALANNPQHQFAARHALVHFDSGAVFTYIPKNACSTLRYSLGLANGALTGPDDIDWIHNNNGTYLATPMQLAIAPYTAVFLRCPYARIVSVFLDKFVDQRRPFWAYISNRLQDTAPPQLTFRAFIHSLKTPAARAIDIHWRPQTDFLVYENYHGVFCLENFADATEVIQREIGLALVDTRALLDHSRTSHTHLETAPDQDEGIHFADMPIWRLAELKRQNEVPSTTAMFDDELIDLVSKYYAPDLALYTENFGSEALTFK